MKKRVLSFVLLLVLLTACSPQTEPADTEVTADTTATFTDEMKIPYQNDLDPEDGADNVEREGDHQNSPYFTSLDYLLMCDKEVIEV